MNESAPHSLITPDVQALAQGSVLAWLATVDERGQPHVTPKEIFALPDAHHAVVAHIASPGSVRRIRTHAQVALSFVNVFLQKGVQLLGTAWVVERGEADFAPWAKDLMVLAGPRFPIAAVIVIRVAQVQPILAPSYTLHPGSTTEASQMQSAWQTYARVAREGWRGAGDPLTLAAEASPAAVVARQLEAYNRRDVEGWLATYHPHRARRRSLLGCLSRPWRNASRRWRSRRAPKAPPVHLANAW